MEVREGHGGNGKGLVKCPWVYNKTVDLLYPFSDNIYVDLGMRMENSACIPILP